MSTLDSVRDFSLASLFTSYPDREVEATLTDLREELSDHPAGGPLLRAGSAGFDEVRSLFLELFDRGGQRASLYETEHGRMRGMSKGNDLADISGFYAAFGFARDETELVDNVAVELEFYSLLLMKRALLVERGDSEGISIVDAARRKFLEDHLGRFIGAIARRPEVSSGHCYGPVFDWVHGLVAAECAALEVAPAPLDFFSDAELKEEMKCGAVHLPTVQ
ncbi:MAG: molecular chaperone TorD family protein [Polyangiaceae bacterium]|nr:molecular chaperone TorD family protein [Polyangiaceae bacterium]MBK8941128.1 molecular chaperone TorD family protein [Polyangiaceae bacterium]